MMKTKHLVTTAGIILAGSLVAATTFAATNSKQKQDNIQVQQNDIESAAIDKNDMLSYIDENGKAQTIDLSEPVESKDDITTYQYSDEQGNKVIVKINQLENADNDKTANFDDGVFSYVDENGKAQTIDLSEPVESKNGITTYQHSDELGNEILVQTNE